MIAIFLTLLISFIATNLFGYLVHRALHQEWMGPFNTSHMAHHITFYPATDMISEEYRSAGKDSTVWFFVVASIPMVALPIILGALGIISISCVVAALVMELGLGFLHNYIHDALHVSNHWLWRVPAIKPWMEKLYHLHFLHHQNMEKNFGIFTFYFDRLFKTFWNT